MCASGVSPACCASKIGAASNRLSAIFINKHEVIMIRSTWDHEDFSDGQTASGIGWNGPQSHAVASGGAAICKARGGKNLYTAKDILGRTRLTGNLAAQPSDCHSVPAQY